MGRGGRYFVAVVAIAAGACHSANAPQPVPAGRPPPPIVNIAVVGATIAPLKRSGMPWDGPPFASRALAASTQAVSMAAPQFETAARLVALVTNGLIERTQPPDSRGTVLILAAGQPLAAPQALPKIQDSFVPEWPPVPVRVQLDDAIRVVLTLEDVDAGELFGLRTNDPIGQITLGPDHLRGALAAGGIFQVRVADQGDGQILFVAVTVTASQ